MSLLTLGVSGGGSILAPGYYWASIYQAPIPTTPTTKFDDVAVGDQTTYEQVTGGVSAIIGMTGMKVTASVTGYTSLEARIYVTDTLTYVLDRWNGSSWVADLVLFDAPPILGPGGQWCSLSAVLDGTKTTTRVRLSIQTQGAGIASDVRIGDYRIS